MVDMVQPCLKLIRMGTLSQHGSWVPCIKDINPRLHSPSRVKMTLLTGQRGMAQRLRQRIAWHGTLMMTALRQGGLELLKTRLLSQIRIPSRTCHDANLHRPANMSPAGLPFLHCAAALCRQYTTMHSCSCSACPTRADDSRARRHRSRAVTAEQSSTCTCGIHCRYTHLTTTRHPIWPLHPIRMIWPISHPMCSRVERFTSCKDLSFTIVHGALNKAAVVRVQLASTAGNES